MLLKLQTDISIVYVMRLRGLLLKHLESSTSQRWLKY